MKNVGLSLFNVLPNTKCCTPCPETKTSPTLSIVT